jgi:hypothetical protein
MANSNRVFVSPGVYTSEKDLTFVAQSVGVTTLGLVGETLKGPAFEPVLITNFDEFRTFFGNTSPAKDTNNYPKYELPYVAKSYLEESNQLFVTRVLGKTGFKHGTSYGIKTLAGVTVDLGSITSETGLTYNDVESELSDKTSFAGNSIADYIDDLTVVNNNWFVIGRIDSSDLPLVGTQLVSPLTGKLNSDSSHNKEWYNVFYDGTNVNSYLFVWNSGTTEYDVTKYIYTGVTLNTDYDDVVVAVLRSRGSYSGQTLNLEVTGTSSVDIDLINNGVDIQINPLGEFTLNVTGQTNTKSFTCSLDTSSSKYISKVLGVDVFDKPKSDFPLYVHESYPKYLESAFENGLIRGLSLTLSTEIEDNQFISEWKTPMSPTVVSEVRGGTVSDLFQVLTISDGESANNQVKVMIQNINIETGEFDVIVRDFNDTDENLVVLERFTRCSMNPDLPGYVARKIGTNDGEYVLRSKYIMLIMNPNHPVDAFPAGFKGFVSNSSFGTSTLGSVMYKTKYFDAGDTIGYEIDGTPILTNGDKVRKVSLGVSSQLGFDKDLLKFKGLQAITETKGFHLSSEASEILDNNSNPIFITTEYDLEAQTGDDDTNKMRNINFRKFTFAVCGGFDGWDIYREVRTNGDGYIFGKSTYVSGNTSNGGVFSSEFGNSDYYSYLDGINSFSNPEAVDINVFATPGIDWFNHSSLVTQAIDMIEEDRADSLYIINAPNQSDFDSADGVSEELDNLGLDSNYSATYWPWIQVRDTDNATQLYIPPTGEVLKNIALTDNVSYPWFAVAGYSRGLVNSIKAFKKLTLDERDELYKNRINPIATFSDTGTIIWGNKTLQIRESALDRINVRRLLLRARKLISAVAVRLLFEQNDEQVRNEFLRLVNPILDSIKKERGLTDFRVVVSNDPEDIDANTLRGKIYIKPTRSLEFIDVEFIITPTGASFENI